MSKGIGTSREKPLIIGAGLMVLDIIIQNDNTASVFKAGGTCGNVLAGLSYLGWNSAAIARIGTDSAGMLMRKDLQACGVDVSYIEAEKKVKTPRIIEKLNSNGVHPKHTFLLRCPICCAYLPRFQSPTLNAVEPILSSRLTPAVFFCDRVSPAILKLAKKYRDRGALIFFEPNNFNNLRDIEGLIAICHVVKYSGDETKDRAPDKNESLLKKLNPPLIIKTMGKEGLTFSYSRSKAWHYQEGIVVNKLKDTCGAGDWCTVGFLYYLNEFAAAQSISLVDALKSYCLIRQSLWHAQIMSALSCSFVGARGLSDAMVRDSLIRAVRNYTTDKTDINTLIGSIPIEQYHTQKSRKISDTVACPVCLLA